MTRRLDPKKLSAAWMDAIQAMTPDELERLARMADRYGGFHTSLATEGDEVIVGMAGVEVLRVPRALIEVDDATVSAS